MSPVAPAPARVVSPNSAARSGGSGGLGAPQHSATTMSVPVELPTQPVNVTLDLDATVANLLDHLLARHRHEMGGSNDIVIWEVASNVRRPVRLIEKVKAIMDTWRLDPGSRYCFETTLGDVRHDLHSLASLIPRRDMLKNPPELRNLIVHYSIPRARSMAPSEWSLCLLNVHTGAVSIAERSQTSSQLKYSKTLQIATVDIYELSKNIGPAKHTLALRSCLPRSYFIDASDSIVYISLDSDSDHSVLRNLVYTLRSTAIEHPHGLVMSSTSINVTGSSSKPSPSSSRSSTPSVRSRANSMRATPLMQHTAFDYDPRFAPTGMLGEQYDARLQRMRAASHSPELSRPDPSTIVGAMSAMSIDNIPERGLMQRVKSTRR